MAKMEQAISLYRNSPREFFSANTEISTLDGRALTTNLFTV